MLQENEIRLAVEKHVKEVAGLGVVSEIIFSHKADKPAQAFYVANEDFSLRRANNPKYKELRRLGSLFEDALSKAGVPLFVSSVNPSQLEGFLTDCARKGFEISRLPVPLAETA